MSTPHRTSELVAENVRALMARTLTRQAALANALGLTQGAVSKKLKGERPFSLDELETVAALFGVPITSLFEQSVLHIDRKRTGHTTGQNAPFCLTTDFGLRLAS